MSLRVVRLAAGATLQDRGRPGWRRYGVPPGGVFDRESYELALALVGLSDGAVLEMPQMGGEFECLDEDRLSVVGASGAVHLDREEMPTNATFTVRPGQRLRIDPPGNGVRTYLAQRSGWRGQLVLGSLSNQSPEAHPDRSGFANAIRSTHRLETEPDSIRERPLRVLPAPQTRPEDRDALAGPAFRVGLASNRLGIRLENGRFEPPEELPSEPSCIGAVQLTPSGELIVHGPDGPTVGGYPKVAVVIEADLDRLGQLRPLDEVRFQWVTMEAARQESQARLARLRQLTAALRLANA